MRWIIVCVLSGLAAMSGLASENWNLTTREVLRTRGQYYDLANYENYLFLACKRGVEIYSISDPAEPELISSFLTDGLANGVAVHYPYLYVGDVYGFSVWDISDILHPIRRGGFHHSGTEGYQERLLYRDGYVFMAAYSFGFQVIDVQDPMNPFIVAQADTPAYSWDLGVKDDAVFMMDFFSLEIIDVSRPLEPLTRMSFEAMFAGGIVIDGNTAYVAFIDGLLVLDISNPFDPQIISRIGTTGGGVGEAITIKDHYMILAHQSYIEIYDVSNPADPVQKAFFYPPGHPRKLLAVGNYLYTILDDSGFQVTDITDPEDPIPGEHINPGIQGSRQDVALHDGYLYLCDWNRGLVIYDASDPEHLTEINTYSTPGMLNDITFDGDFAYLSCYSELQVVDVSDPASPQYVGNYRTSGNPWSIHVSGDRGYLCDIYTFQVLDLSDPSNIQRLGALVMSKTGTVFRTTVLGNTAYVAHGWGGLKMIDISDPTHPVQVAEYPPEKNRSYSTLKLIHGADHYILYALDSGSGVDILSLESPRCPKLISTVSAKNAQFADFHLEADLLYLAATDMGIFVVDTQNVENPMRVGRAETPGNALGITADSERVFVADDYDLAVFQKNGLSPDNSEPDVTVTPMDQVVRTKTAIIQGTASDPESGIHYVEISVNDGESWEKAMGQETWSYILKGIAPGMITPRVRATNWAGIVSEENSSPEFYFLPPRPMIMLAGFENSRVERNGTSTFRISAIVFDPYSYLYIDSIQVFQNDQFLDITLEPVVQTDQYAYYAVDMSGPLPDDPQVEYHLLALDRFGNPSACWPFLSARP